MPQPLFIFCDFPVDLSMKILSNTSQSFRTHLFHHSRTRLFLCFCMILLLVFETNICQAEELPHIPETKLYWGMPYQEARDMLPGQHKGFMIIRRQEFANMPNHPVTGQYFFNAQQQLGYAQFTPAYQHQKHPEYWIGEYEHITGYMTGIYGNPVTITDGRTIWQSPKTQGQLIQNSVQQDVQEIQTGWIFRFDPIPEEQGGE